MQSELYTASELKEATEVMVCCRRGLSLPLGGRGNLVGLLQDLQEPPQCMSMVQADVLRLENEAKNLISNLEACLRATIQEQPTREEPTPTENMADRCSEVEELRSRVSALQREHDKVCAQLSLAQADNSRLRDQLTHQSSFCASLGAVLGTLVWKASRVPPVVDLLLSGNKATDFLCIVSGTLESFLETFNTEMPGSSADESQFIMAMGGIVTNMAAAPAGRQFLVTDQNGQDLIQQIVKVLPVIPTPSGNCLKRLLLMALYNISINQAGLNLLFEDGRGNIFSAAANCLKPESTKELKVMALRLLVSLTCEINDPNLIAKVPKDIITELTSSDDCELKNMAQDVDVNVFKAQERLRQMPNKNNGAKLLQGNIKSHRNELERINNVNTATWRLPTHQ